MQGTRLGHCHRHIQCKAIAIRNLVERRRTAPAKQRSTKNLKPAPKERMARIKDLNLLWKRFVSITKGGIPKHLRWKALTGAGFTNSRTRISVNPGQAFQ